MYSHPATKQDEWVLSQNVKWGTFVELGAYDGLTHSNTRLLEELGWRGRLIEGCEEFAKQCKVNRPKAEVINAVIGDGRREEFVIGGQYSGITRLMPDDFMEEHNKRGNKLVYVDTKTLTDVLGTEPVTYLSLDTEGGELDILREWFKSGGRCELLTVEFRYKYDQIFLFDALCYTYGMVLDQIRGFDLCYKRMT